MLQSLEPRVTGANSLGMNHQFGNTVPQIHKLSLVLTRACSIPSMTMTPSMVWKEEWAKVHRLQSRKLAIFLCLTSGRTINLQRNTNTAQQDSSAELSHIPATTTYFSSQSPCTPKQLPTYMVLSLANQGPDHHGPAAGFPPGSLTKLLTGLTTFPPSLLGQLIQQLHKSMDTFIPTVAGNIFLLLSSVSFQVYPLTSRYILQNLVRPPI